MPEESTKQKELDFQSYVETFEKNGSRGKKEIKYAETNSATLHYQTQKSLSTKNFDTAKGEHFPSADLSTPNKKLKAYAVLKPREKEISPYPNTEELTRWQNRISDLLLNMNDLTADVFDSISAIWLRQAKHYESMVTIKADDFLQFRGLKQKKGGNNSQRGGYEIEQRQAIAEQIEILSRTWIKVLEMEITEEVAGKKGSFRKRRKWGGESLAIVVSSKFGELDDKNILDPFVWNVRPGDVFSKFLFGAGRQTALLAQKALEYDPYRQKFEKRLARYLAYQWRIRQQGGNYLQPFMVETLLNAIGLEINQKHPNRAKEILEKILDTLLKDNLIKGWQYENGIDESIVGKRDWSKEWIQWKIFIEPPQVIMDQYAQIKSPPTTKTAKQIEKLSPSQKEEIGKKFKETRLKRGLTQMQIAEELGIHQSHISRIEKGQSTSKETLKKIEKWFATLSA